MNLDDSELHTLLVIRQLGSSANLSNVTQRLVSSIDSTEFDAVLISIRRLIQNGYICFCTHMDPQTSELRTYFYILDRGVAVFDNVFLQSTE